MTAARLRIKLDLLGVESQWLAAQLGKDPRTVYRWVAGGNKIVPAYVWDFVESLDRDAWAQVEEILREGKVEIFRKDKDILNVNEDDPVYDKCQNDTSYGPRLRAVVARALERDPNLTITYRD